MFKNTVANFETILWNIESQSQTNIKELGRLLNFTQKYITWLEGANLPPQLNNTTQIKGDNQPNRINRNNSTWLEGVNQPPQIQISTRMEGVNLPPQLHKNASTDDNALTNTAAQMRSHSYQENGDINRIHASTIDAAPPHDMVNSAQEHGQQLRL